MLLKNPTKRHEAEMFHLPVKYERILWFSLLI